MSPLLSFWNNMKTYQKILLGMLAGAALGYAYYYFIGCNSGTCPITWYISTLYGAFTGVVVAIPSKKRLKDGN